MHFPEQNAIISGIGISDIGRKTGTPGLDLTVQSASAAVADAGLTPADIDTVLTLGDTPAAEAARALGIESPDLPALDGDAGLLAPVQQAAVAVGERRARHVHVYRTVQMMGGTVDRPRRSGENLQCRHTVRQHRQKGEHEHTESEQGQQQRSQGRTHASGARARHRAPIEPQQPETADGEKAAD